VKDSNSTESLFVLLLLLLLFDAGDQTPGLAYATQAIYHRAASPALLLLLLKIIIISYFG
jgi:hypothetical protein